MNASEKILSLSSTKISFVVQQKDGIVLSLWLFLFTTPSVRDIIAETFLKLDVQMYFSLGLQRF